MFADEFLLVVALMDVTDMAAIEDAAFSTGFVVFDQVKISYISYIRIITAMNYIYASHVEDLLQ